MATSEGISELIRYNSILDELELKVSLLERAKKMRPPPGLLSPGNSRLHLHNHSGGSSASNSGTNSGNNSNGNSPPVPRATFAEVQPTPVASGDKKDGEQENFAIEEPAAIEAHEDGKEHNNGAQSEPQESSTEDKGDGSETLKATETPDATGGTKADEGTLHITVTGGHTTPGQELFVSGSTEKLGSWEPSKALKLRTEKKFYPAWKGSLTEKKGTDVTFKFFKMTRNDPSTIVWDNHPDYSATVSDESVELTQPWSA